MDRRGHPHPAGARRDRRDRRPAVVLDDADAIVEPEASFVGAILTPDDVRGLAGHVDWSLPTETGVLAQGKVAGVPAKVVGGTPALLFIQAAYADELRRRLGWG